MIPILQFILYLFICLPLIFVTAKFIINNVKSYIQVSKLSGFHQNPNIFIGHARLLTIALKLNLRGIEAGKTVALAGKTAPFKDVGYMCGWLGNPLIGCPVLIPTRVELVKEILGNKQFVHKSTMYCITNIAFGRGLLNSYRGTWARHRKLLNPTFHQHLLQKYAVHMSSQSVKLVEELKEQLKGSCDNLVPNFTHKLSPRIMAMLLESIMGVEEGDLDPNFMNLAEKFDPLMCSRITTPWKAITPLYACTSEGSEIMNAIKFGRNEVKRIIAKRLKTSKKISENFDDISPKIIDDDDEIRKPTLIDCLIEEHNCNPLKMPVDDIIDEVLNFLFAGWDTTTWSLTIILQLLGCYPSIQEKVYKEICSVFGENIFSKKDENVFSINLNDISMGNAKKLKYMECVIFESLRLYPLVNIIGRRLTEELSCQIDGNVVTFPKWTEVVIDSDLIHRNEKYWKDPNRFHPERFMTNDNKSENCGDSENMSENPENTKNIFNQKIEPFTFIPFSAGARNCIGKAYGCLEIKIILCHILRDFKITSKVPMDKIKFNFVGTVRRTDENIQFIFEPRQSSLTNS